MPDKTKAFPDFLPDEVWKWKLMEERFDHILKLHNYHEIRLSILQDSGLITQGITALMQGREAERVAQRTINVCDPDGGQGTLSLRPEGTISVLNHTAKHHRKGDIHRYYYHGPMFRQARDKGAAETFQLGVELLGSDSILSENEIISLGMRILRDLGFREASLVLNSFGCENCRRQFFADVCADLEKHSGDYCRSCMEELRANPFTETQCEDERCRHTVPEELQIGKYLCTKCKANFERIKKIQANLGHSYRVDPRLFKNFAYYNETVFDFVVRQGDKELTVGGGGRYDYLSERVTGRKIPAVGFYLDLDLIFRLMDTRKLFLTWSSDFSVYICAQSPDMEMMILQIAQELHSHDIITVLSTETRNTENELKHARANKCDLMIAIREENIREGKLLLYNLDRDDQAYIPLNRLAESVQISRKTLNK
jgi:histidyl-tRNA synthetase